MRKVVLFLCLPFAVCAFIALSAYQNHQNKLSNLALARGIEKYKREQPGWPHNFATIEPYLEEPDTVRPMSPTFFPISDREAYLEENTWSNGSAKRVGFRVILSSNGKCTLHPSRRL